MRKALYTLVLVTFIMVLFPLAVFATEDNTKYSSGHFYYHDHEGYVSICGYLGKETDISIPANISGKPVSEIESGAFNGCDSIKSIEVPDTVMMVADDSFTGAGSLEKIVSHTVGVNITADQGVNIDYASEKNGSANITNDKQETANTTSKNDKQTQTEQKDTDNNTSASDENTKRTEKEKTSQVADQKNTDQGSDTSKSSQSADTRNKRNSDNTVEDESIVNESSDVGSGCFVDSSDYDNETEAVQDTYVKAPESDQNTDIPEQISVKQPESDKQSSPFLIFLGFAAVISVIAGVIVFIVAKIRTK